MVKRTCYFIRRNRNLVIMCVCAKPKTSLEPAMAALIKKHKQKKNVVLNQDELLFLNDEENYINLDNLFAKYSCAPAATDAHRVNNTATNGGLLAAPSVSCQVSSSSVTNSSAFQSARSNEEDQRSADIDPFEPHQHQQKHKHHHHRRHRHQNTRSEPVELEVKDPFIRAQSANYDTFDENVDSVSMLSSSSTASHKHTRPRRLKNYLYNDYNYDIQKLEATSSYQQHLDNLTPPTNAPNANNLLQISVDEVQLPVPASENVSGVSSKKRIWQKSKKKKQRDHQDDDIKFALPSHKLQDIDKLVALLDQLDKQSAGAHDVSTVSDADSFSRGGPSAVKSLASSSVSEAGFRDYHSRSLDISSKVQSMVDEQLKRELSYELIIEHERGIILFGYPFFNKSALIKGLDPPLFVNKHNKPVNITERGHSTTTGAFSYNMNLYPLDAANWKWKWDKWYVLMLEADTDDQGWVYSGLTFYSSNWRGKYRFGNSVRKRVWIRLKERRTRVIHHNHNKNAFTDDTAAAATIEAELNLTRTEGNDLLVVGSLQEKEGNQQQKINKEINHFFDKLEGFYLDRFKIEFLIETLTTERYLTIQPTPRYSINKALLYNTHNFDRIIRSFLFDESKVILSSKLQRILSAAANGTGIAPAIGTDIEADLKNGSNSTNLDENEQKIIRDFIGKLDMVIHRSVKA